ncbi:oxidoreductase [Bradyrhizobium iriomotense]|uniref:Oxidoreductase n=2 Tax=Bradyrhizobium iriomotense TaxID=441950 RepID=A0ABQ6B5R4_9BRAD|nr:oxidoreductase [Bradyrhizobium iriomotense]
MRCLIVKAHPLDASFCQTLSDAAVEFLTAAGHECRLVDLYQSNFAPALTKRERQSYYSNFDASAITREIDDLLWAEAIVLVFPTWWFGFPAILKGWFDRVWAPGVAYDHAPDLGAIRPRLNDLRRVVGITTLGSPWWVDWLLLRQPVRRILKTAILGTCAPKAALTFLPFYKAEKLSQQDVQAAVARMKNVLRRI